MSYSGDGNQLMAVGFIGDYRGGSDLLDQFRPVVCFVGRDDALYVPTRMAWSATDLQQLSELEFDYINRFSQPIFVDEGATIAVAGTNFYNRCARLPELASYGSNIRSNWSMLGSYAYRVSSPAHFQQISNGIWNHGQPMLYAAIMGQHNLQELGKDYFRILQGVVGLELQDTWRTFAVFYKETYQQDQYEMLRTVVVSSKLAESDQQFDELVRADVDWLRERRVAADGSANTTQRPSWLEAPALRRALTRAERGPVLFYMHRNSPFDDIHSFSFERIFDELGAGSLDANNE